MELLTPPPGGEACPWKRSWNVEPVRNRQRNRVQEDFGDGQIACAMMTMVFGSEPSPHKSSSRNLAPATKSQLPRIPFIQELSLLAGRKCLLREVRAKRTPPNSASQRIRRVNCRCLCSMYLRPRPRVQLWFRFSACRAPRLAAHRESR